MDPDHVASPIAESSLELESFNSLLHPPGWPERLSTVLPPLRRAPCPQPLSQPQTVPRSWNLNSCNLNAYLEDTSPEVYGLPPSSPRTLLPSTAETSSDDERGCVTPIDPDSSLRSIARLSGRRSGPEDQDVDITPPETALEATRCLSCPKSIPTGLGIGDLCYWCRQEAAPKHKATSRRPKHKATGRRSSNFRLSESNGTPISQVIPNPSSSGRILSPPPLSLPIPEMEEQQALFPSRPYFHVNTGPALDQPSEVHLGNLSVNQTGPSSSEQNSMYDLVSGSLDPSDLFGSPRSVALLEPRKSSTGHDLFGAREAECLPSMKTSLWVVLETIAGIISILGPKPEVKEEFQGLGTELENLNEFLIEIFNLHIPSRHEVTANAVKTMSLTCYSLLKAFREKLLTTRTTPTYEYSSGTIIRRIYEAEIKEEARKLQAYIAAHVGSLNRRLLSLTVHSNYQSRTKNSESASNGQMPMSRFEKSADLIGSTQGSEAFTNQGDSPGNSMRSEESESADDDEYLIVLLAKHKILASLMREVYNILGYNPTESLEQSPSDAGESNAGPSSYQADSEHGRSQNKGGKGKKRVTDRDSQPPDEDENDGGKKRFRGEPDPSLDGDGRLYACPFFKYDPRKYNSNSSTGKKYRTCAGPGWGKIARLKQHLERTHCAPIQCRRCWQDFPNEAALTDHSRSKQQCPVLPQSPIESIPLHKWDIIKSRWGATWNFIFGILFPGVTIPSRYYDDMPSTQLLPPSPPASQDFADYEAYSRKELPRLIEGILDGMINAEREPLDEKFKPLVLEIVRNCHSTLGHRWDMIKEGSLPKPLAFLPAASNLLSLVGQPLPSQRPISTPNTNIESTAVPSIYQVPPALSGDVADATFQAFEESQNALPGLNRLAQSDSGYESQLPVDRFCTCRPVLELDTFFADSFVIPSNLSLPSVQEPTLAKGNWSAETSGGTVSISQERTIVKCSFCGGWRDK